MAETHNHLVLKEIAKNKLFELGFNEEEISYEYRIVANNNKYIVDVVGISKNNKIAVECGFITGNPNKIMDLLSFFDEVVHLPYKGRKYQYTCNSSKQKRVAIRIPQKMYNRILAESSGVGNSVSDVVRIAINEHLKRK